MVRPRALSRGLACWGGACDRVAVDVVVAAATVQTEPSLGRANWRVVALVIGPTAVPGAILFAGGHYADPLKVYVARTSTERSPWLTTCASRRSIWLVRPSGYRRSGAELPTGRGCSAPSSSPATRSTGMHCHIQLRPVSTDSWSSRRTCFAASRALCSCSSSSPGLAAPRVRLRRDLRRRFVDRGDDRECWLEVSV